MSLGLMTSGSNRICSDALAGQISVTPLIRLSRTALVIDSDLKKASSDISSSTSTKTCSSPPNEYRVFMAIALHPSSQAASPGANGRDASQASSQRVCTAPALTSSLSSSARCSARVVGTPSIASASSATRIRSSA